MTRGRRIQRSMGEQKDARSKLRLARRLRVVEAHAASLESEAGALLQRAEKAENASRAKSEMIAATSHELRTPLGAILGFTELLLEDAIETDSADYKVCLGDIQRSGRHLLQLSTDILDLARIEAGRLTLRSEAVDLAELVAEVCSTLRATAASRGIRIQASVDAEARVICADALRTRQVLYNYLSNAIKFTKQGGRVVVRVLEEGDEEVRIEVVDEGVGIAASELKRLFFAFEQPVARNPQIGAGVGLGLALTRRLVEAQGGRVGVRSVPGSGATFFAVLRRNLDQGAAMEESGIRLKPLRGVDRSEHHERVAEDDAANFS